MDPNIRLAYIKNYLDDSFAGITDRVKNRNFFDKRVKSAFHYISSYSSDDLLTMNYDFQFDAMKKYHHNNKGKRDIMIKYLSKTLMDELKITKFSDKSIRLILTFGDSDCTISINLN